MVDVFVVGAAKSGTTSLFEFFSSQNSLVTYKGKELNFFLRNEIQRDDLKWFEKQFVKSTGQLSVEFGNMYLPFAEIAAPIIAQYNPNAKIIICRRDPIKRLSSHLKMHIEGNLRAIKNIDDYILKLLNRRTNIAVALKKDYSTLSKEEKMDWEKAMFLESGRYLEKGKIFQDYFGRDNVLFIDSEHISSDETVESIKSFLQLDLNGVIGRSNVARKLRFKGLFKVQRLIGRLIKPVIRVLPDSVTYRFYRFYNWLKRINSVPNIESKIPFSPALLIKLREYYIHSDV